MGGTSNASQIETVAVHIRGGGGKVQAYHFGKKDFELGVEGDGPKFLG